jgi:hypothetical protein
MPKSKKTHYARLEFKFSSVKAAWRAYRFLSAGVEMDILPRVEMQLTDKTLTVGWYGSSFEIKI